MCHVCVLCVVLCCGGRFVAGGNPLDAAFQLKSLIKSLHAAGIEVLLEVRQGCTVDKRSVISVRLACSVMPPPPKQTNKHTSTNMHAPTNPMHLHTQTALPLQAEFCMTSEAGGGIGGRLQSYAGLDGDIYLRGGGGPEASGVLNTGVCGLCVAASADVASCRICWQLVQVHTHADSHTQLQQRTWTCRMRLHRQRPFAPRPLSPCLQASLSCASCCWMPCAGG